MLEKTESQTDIDKFHQQSQTASVCWHTTAVDAALHFTHTSLHIYKDCGSVNKSGQFAIKGIFWQEETKQTTMQRLEYEY